MTLDNQTAPSRQLTQIHIRLFTGGRAVKVGVARGVLVKETTIFEVEGCAAKAAGIIHAVALYCGVIAGKAGFGELYPVAIGIAYPLVVKMHLAGFGALQRFKILQEGVQVL